MATTQQLALPNEKFRLEEINMPEELAASLAGQTVTVEVFPEEPTVTRSLDRYDSPEGMLVYIDGYGRAWNDHRAERVLYRDSAGRFWRLPRHWLSDGVSPVIEASRCAITQESSWLESWCSPTWWDLWDINIQERPTANSGPGRGRHRSERCARRNPQGLLERSVREGVEDSARLAEAAHQAA